MGDFVRQLVIVLPILGGFALVWAANVPRSRRHQQYPMPFVAVVYSIAALWLLYRTNLWYEQILERVFDWLPFLEQWYQVSWQFGLQNGMLLTAFAALKVLLRGLVLARVFVGEHFLGSRFVSEFYEYDNRTGEWLVRAKFALLRNMLLTLLGVSLAITVGMILLARNYPGWPVFQAIAFPAVAVIVLGECYFALAGLTRREAYDEVYGEEDSAERRVDYSTLRRVYRDQFGERVLADASRLTGPHLPSTFDSLHLLRKSTLAQEAAAGSYFARLKEQGHELDPGYVRAAVSLLNRNSVLIHNPFHRDLTDYLAFPAHLQMMEGQNCLVIVGREGAEDDVAGWIREGVEGISGVPGLWRVEVLGPHTSPALNMGILRAADLHNFELIRNHDAFLERVGLIMVVEPSRALATGQVGLRLVSDRCRRGTPPVVVAIDGNHDGLVDALSQLFQVQITNVVASPAARGASSSMVWDARGQNLRSRFAPVISRQVGVGMEIGAVALKYHVSEIDWVGGDSVPVHDLMWISGQYFQDLTSFAELEVSQAALTDPLTPLSSATAMEQRPNRFVIAEDEESNLFERQRQLATRATQNGFVHIISNDYLMRDYMVANRAIFESDAKAIPSIVADFAQSERSVTIRLMAMMELARVSEHELSRELEAIGVSVGEGAPDDGEPRVLRELRTLVERHTGVRDVQFDDEITYADVTDSEGERSFSISGGAGLQEFLRSLRSAYFVVEDSEEDRDYIGACLYGHVYQTFLPGQFITYVGKHYEVRRVASTAGGDHVILRRAADHIRDARVYRPLLNVRIAGLEMLTEAADPRQVSGVSTARMRGSIRVGTQGYVESHSRSGSEARRVEISGVPERSYKNKDILRITLPGAPPSTRRAVAFLLNELFVTMFPHAHPFLWAITEDPDSSHADLRPVWEDPVEDDSILVIEDSMVDLGLVVAVERNLNRILEIVTDAVAWQVEVREAREAPAPSAPGGEFRGFDEESAEEAEARAEAARQQEAGQPLPDARGGVFRSWWRALLGLFRRRRAAGKPASEPQPVLAEPQVDERDPEPEAADLEPDPAESETARTEHVVAEPEQIETEPPPGAPESQETQAAAEEERDD